MPPTQPEQNNPDEIGAIRLIRPDWPAPANVHALSTTRCGGYSQGLWAGLNLGNRGKDEPANILKNRSLLRTAAALPDEPVWLHQIHGTQVLDVDAMAGPTEADASFSASAGVVCAILSADCLPVLFCDEHGQRVAAAHAGWRGLAGGLLEATVAAMQVRPARLLAWLGPAIGPLAYEVGDEVRDQFIAADGHCESAFQRSANGRWLADLYTLARGRLKRLGIDRVYGGGYCTHSDSANFFSYRRDGSCGRMASCVWRQD